ncbi:hypothetical protein FBEOM_1805 [Fusarium beomiforme]|uniref:Uncharacterized protein n=1 Tax=Fusarium beomiforme TaxID=44412 RepID=A0A9P5ASK8_9HYPO|nr:hypothetical protein FBEOM_1805 [Fusarium beomiforme]
MSEKTKSAFFDHSEFSSTAPPPFSQAVAAGQPSTLRYRFASITRHGTDRIRLINFSDVEMGAVHEIVRTTWDRGIDKVYSQETSREFKLKGFPWGYDPDGNEQAMLLTIRILEVNHTPPPCEWLNASFHGHGGDKLKILNHPPADLVKEIVSTFSTDIQRHEVTKERIKIKFKEYPWRSLDSDGAETQLKVLALFEVLERNGFTLYARPGAKFNFENDPFEPNVFVFQRRKESAPEAPVYHKS